MASAHFERTERIVDALLHRKIEIRDAADALIHRVGRLVDEHRDGTHHDHARDVADRYDCVAALLQRSDDRGVRRSTALARARHGERSRRAIVEREVDEHDVIVLKVSRAVGCGLSVRDQKQRIVNFGDKPGNVARAVDTVLAGGFREPLDERMQQRP